MSALPPDLLSKLAEGADILKCPLPEPLIEKCSQHVEILLRWNRVHNLTTVIEPEQILTHHLLDSLTIASLVKGTRLLDIGSGGGFPGIPLALALRETKWILIDSRGKRARFLQEVIELLALDRVSAIHQRVEDYLPTENFDTLVTRAVAPLPKLITLTEHLWKKGVRLIVMKADGATKEWKQLPSSLRSKSEIIPLSVPGTKLNRKAVVFEN
tara:strand:+ start:351 stop:989 length:639 start_codon:yes stop_codon:yes gene_type:complete